MLEVPESVESPPLTADHVDPRFARLASELEHDFGTPVVWWNAEAGEPLCTPQGVPAGPTERLAEWVRDAARSGQVSLLGEDGPVVALALPIAGIYGQDVVAVARFATQHLAPQDSLDEAAALWGGSADALRAWIERQLVWTPESVLRLGRAVQRRVMAEQSVSRREREIEALSLNLNSTYEEITLLYGLAQHLGISRSPYDLARLVLDWVSACVPAEALAIRFVPRARSAALPELSDTPDLLSVGECPVNDDVFDQLVGELSAVKGCPRVANRSRTSRPDWSFRGIREVILVTLAEGDRVFGYLAAFNHTEDGDFGTVEANLLDSIASLLGIHSSNCELYREQEETLADIVRALTSAIDAKDPYTCGHSDRVARIAVRLAQQLAVEPPQLKTIYMAGLVHDIGKIGIDDQVLRKPGRLSPEEFEHIKQHPELGYKILADLRQLSDVVPAVLFHHEQWNGQGYPWGLAGDEIPLIARIIAVADACDAMTSDRPYRAGMPPEKVDEIFRQGAGKHWDADVVNAFLTIRDEIREIARRPPAPAAADLPQWT